MRWVLSLGLFSASLMCAGRAFPWVGAVAEKALSPELQSRVLGMVHWGASIRGAEGARVKYLKEKHMS